MNEVVSGAPDGVNDLYKPHAYRLANKILQSRASRNMRA
jgi:hypothetical protein